MYKTLEYQAGCEYQISKLLAKDRRSRDAMIALGLIPGEIIYIIRSMFWGNYWIIRIRNQRIGLRLSELKRLQLHVIPN